MAEHLRARLQPLQQQRLMKAAQRIQAVAYLLGRDKCAFALLALHHAVVAEFVHGQANRDAAPPEPFAQLRLGR
ncbi:hypothetical protein SAMN03159304_00929 [Pseudomonas sp. NFACC24-1]|nr:hypothetical protein SAMN03159304_00929 [Pseudomonas sp. NFACC24-1]